MLVVVAFCSKDAGLQRKNLEWCLELDAGCGREGVLSYDTATSKADVDAIENLAKQYFTKVHHCQYAEPPVKGWPAACNWAWQSTARWMVDTNMRQPWFWLEADAMPLKSGWVGALEEAHKAGGKSFGGHVVKDMWHMNGVGIYPWDVSLRNEMAMLARAAAWDVVLKPNILNDCVNLNHLIQHAWNVHPTDRNMIWNGDGTPLSFKDDSDVDRYMDFNAVLLHRVKDGSLIHFLRERKHAEEKRIEEEQRRISSTEYNVPQHIRVEDKPGVEEVDQQVARSIADIATGPVKGNRHWPKTEILIVTYFKDKPWLDYCLKLLKKNFSGHTGITVAYPSRDKFILEEFIEHHGIKAFTYDEIEGKGMIQHMAMMAMADHIVHGSEYIMHLDADCMYHTKSTPADYFTGGKPDYLVRSWESLKDANGVVSDCYQWFEPTRIQLGFPPKVYSMCRHPTVLPVGFYKPYREWIEAEHKRPFMDYMTSGKNSFPQDKMDWTAMGAFAYEFMRDEFHWIDIGANGAVVPRDRIKVYWSHGGIKPETKAEIEGWL